jgi:DNA-damage-inducible protein J
MMAQTMVNFRMDEDLKNKMDAVCKEMGLSSTTAYTIFARKVVRENRIPFEVNADPFYSESNMTFLRNAVKALNNGEGTAHDLIEVD